MKPDEDAAGFRSPITAAICASSGLKGRQVAFPFTKRALPCFVAKQTIKFKHFGMDACQQPYTSNQHSSAIEVFASFAACNACGLDLTQVLLLSCAKPLILPEEEALSPRDNRLIGTPCLPQILATKGRHWPSLQKDSPGSLRHQGLLSQGFYAMVQNCLRSRGLQVLADGCSQKITFSWDRELLRC